MELDNKGMIEARDLMVSMVEKKATEDELMRIVQYTRAVINARRDIRMSRDLNDIDSLKNKYGEKKK